MQYQRSQTHGGTYFFTVNLCDRGSRLLTTHIETLRHALRTVRQTQPFRIVAWVVLPEHMHAIWEMPPDDNDYSSRWGRIKGNFSRQIPRDERISPSRTGKRERGIWQRRFWEHQIRDERDLHQHVDYIHYNPVKHCYVDTVVDWPYSTFHNYVNKGWLSPNWGYNDDFAGNFGERR